MHGLPRSNLIPPNTENRFHIVGVGASAGGLEALEKFFDNMCPDSGLAFVVIQHLSPDFRSLMDELLRRHTALAIHRVEDGMVVEPNSIYLIPPKKEMIFSGGRLLLTDKDPSQGLSLPIDTFFRSLAQDVGERAIGIVLSGTGSDGSRGIRDIHEAGGLVLAQSDDSAKFDGMPRSAMDTGVVDLELSPEEMPAALLRYVQHPQGELIRDTAHTAGVVGSDLDTVLRLLRQEYGIDFSHYKPSTIARRIERRLVLSRSADLADYAGRLQSDAGELSSLYQDLLIDEQRRLVHAFGGAGDYLTVRDGRHSSDLLDLIHPDLRTPLAGALQRAVKQNAVVTYKDVRLTTAEGLQRVKMTVAPVSHRGLEAGYLLVSLAPLDVGDAAPLSAREIDFGEASREQVRGLEDELRYTKENLQATIEELETSNEELQATNEELVASNEELQSTNEELHSVNEELYTVNAEYQRKIAELTELTDDMDNLLRSTDVGVMFLDRDLCIRKFTPKIAEFFDLLPQDIGRRIAAFAHRIACDGLFDDVSRVLTDRQVVERQVRDEQGKHFLLRVLPYRSKTATDGAVVTIFDISLLKETETGLRRMSKVFMDGADPIIVEDLQGRIVDLNAEAERAYGWKRDELLGRNVDLLVPPDQRILSRSLRQRCRNAEHVRNVEVIRCTKSGETSPVLLTLSLLADESGVPAAIATIAKDIRVQKKAEQEAREAVRRRDQFLAMLSHELRNPLAAVLNAVNVFAHGGADRARHEHACGVIRRQAGQMARLLDDLLDVSRVTQSKIVLRKEICDLRSVVLHAVEEVRPLIGDRRHQLVVQVSEQPLVVSADPTRLLQILGNLLTNAAKYTPLGGRIRLDVEPDGDFVEIRVGDTGEGIPADMLEAVFDLFVQSHASLERSEGGMGVGLTLVRKLVELHGGSVWARSDGPGRGSQFVVRLPLTDERAPAGVDTKVRASASEAASASLRVLLVEDNADSREMLQSWLELEGYQVESADSGARGLEKLLTDPPDVALVDIGLPEIDGYEVARRVRASDVSRKVRLVAVTGYGRSEDHQAILDAGFDEHLVKPVDPRNLARALHKPR